MYSDTKAMSSVSSKSQRSRSLGSGQVARGDLTDRKPKYEMQRKNMPTGAPPDAVEANAIAILGLDELSDRNNERARETLRFLRELPV